MLPLLELTSNCSLYIKIIANVRPLKNIQKLVALSHRLRECKRYGFFIINMNQDVLNTKFLQLKCFLGDTVFIAHTTKC